MKKTVLALLTVALISCAPEADRQVKAPNGVNFDVIVVDSCEYLYRNIGHSGYMAHKGNCRFCAQRAANHPSH